MVNTMSFDRRDIRGHSIIQLRSLARKKYSTMGVKKMIAMLTPKGMHNIVYTYNVCIGTLYYGIF